MTAPGGGRDLRSVRSPERAGFDLPALGRTDAAWSGVAFTTREIRILRTYILIGYF